MKPLQFQEALPSSLMAQGQRCAHYIVYKDSQPVEGYLHSHVGGSVLWNKRS